MEKLLPRSRLPLPRDVAPLLVAEKGKEDSLSEAQRPIYKPSTATQQPSDAAEEKVEKTMNETLRSTAEEYVTLASAGTELNIPAAGERLFVFREPPESCEHVDAPQRKRKRNFLNLKRASVAPTNLPWNSFWCKVVFFLYIWWYFLMIYAKNP